MTFDTDFVKGQVDALLCYMQSEGVRQFEYKNHENWKISFRRLVVEA